VSICLYTTSDWSDVHETTIRCSVGAVNDRIQQSNHTWVPTLPGLLRSCLSAATMSWPVSPTNRQRMVPPMVLPLVGSGSGDLPSCWCRPVTVSRILVAMRTPHPPSTAPCAGAVRYPSRKRSRMRHAASCPPISMRLSVNEGVSLGQISNRIQVVRYQGTRQLTWVSNHTSAVAVHG
jgi:hypothetical protein